MSALSRLRKKFPVLTPPKVKAEARVAIAEDVIETLDVGRMYVSSGTGYHRLRDWAKGVFGKYEATALSLRVRGKTRCTVCAIGAACLSAVGLYNDAQQLEDETLGIYGPDSDNMRDVLARWFTRVQLDLIESAFEKDYFGIDANGDALRRAIKFGERYLGDEERLRAIMGNIIDNDGTFRP